MEGWKVRVLCPMGRHEGWIDVGTTSPIHAKCGPCNAELNLQDGPKTGWLARRRMHKQVRNFLKDQRP